MNTSPLVVMCSMGYLPDEGGIERYAAEIARGYVENGFRVIVVTQTSIGPGVRRDGNVVIIDRGPGRQIVADGQLIVREVSTVHQARMLMDFLGVWRSLRRRYRPSIFHATTWRMSLPAFLAPSRAAVVTTVHGREVFAVGQKLKPVMRAALARATRVLVVSDAVRRRARDQADLPSDAWQVVWNGTSYVGEGPAIPTCPPRPHHGPVRIATLCRLVPRKNIPAAVRAIARLASLGYDNIRYEIAGGGPDRSLIEWEIADHALQDHVTLRGRIDDNELPGFYANADIFLHPQIDLDGDVEGFGLVIADAMSFGAAIIAGRDGGPADFIQPGTTGVLVDGTNESELVAALKELIDDPDRRARIATAGHTWVHKTLRWSVAAEKGVAGLPTWPSVAR